MAAVAEAAATAVGATAIRALVQAMEKQAATMDVQKQAKVLPVMLTALKAIALRVQDAVQHFRVTAAAATEVAAAAVHAFMKKIAAAVSCHGDRLTVGAAWRVRGAMRKSKLKSKIRQSNLKTTTMKVSSSMERDGVRKVDGTIVKPCPLPSTAVRNIDLVLQKAGGRRMTQLSSESMTSYLCSPECTKMYSKFLIFREARG